MSGNTTDGKVVIIDRIHKAVAKASAGPLAGDRDRPRFERVAAQSPFPQEATLADYVERFKVELQTLASSVYGPFDAAGAAEAVLKIARQKAAFKVLAWEEAEIGCPPLGDALERASIQMIPGDVPNTREHQTALEKLAQIEVGLTGANAGLADTGSIIVASGPGRPRNASLLPPVHIAVLRVSRIFPTMQDWLTAEGTALAPETANLVVITGGSRTSDIELQLTLGMHGPKELHVVLYDDM